MGRAFEKRKHTIFARMDRVGKLFSKCGKDIAIAVKSGGGTTADTNPTLRRVLQNARAVNMPKDRIDAAIKKASGVGAANYDVVLYEGYGPHGVAMLVETATDNVTRTVANIRMHFKSHGGNLGATSSVAFMFQRQGVFRLDPMIPPPAGAVRAKPEPIDRDALELELIDHGLIVLEDGETDKGDKLLVIRCAFTDFGAMQTALEARNIHPVSTAWEYVPTTPSELADEKKIDEVMELVATLEGDDDVQNVYTVLA